MVVEVLAELLGGPLETRSPGSRAGRDRAYLLLPSCRWSPTATPLCIRQPEEHRESQLGRLEAIGGRVVQRGDGGLMFREARAAGLSAFTSTELQHLDAPTQT